MSIRGRLLLAFAGIIACFVVSFGVTVAANRIQAHRLQTLEQSVERQAAVASIKRRLHDLQKELALLVAIYESAASTGATSDQQARFEGQLTAISWQLGELKERGEESAPQRQFRVAFENLSRSWTIVHRNLGVDTAAAITELSVRGDPLGEAILREHLPRWEDYEKSEVARASGELRSVTATARAAIAAIFALSTAVALFIAYRISRHLLRINEELEARVVERTKALQQEVAEHRRTEAALRESEERYAIAARGANDGLWDWDVRRGTIYYSPRWKAMLGYADHEISDSPAEWLDRVHHDDRADVQAKIRSHLERTTTHFESEHRVLHRDGAYRWMLCRGLAVFDPDGKPVRMAGSQTDITARKGAEERLIHDALHDALTGLANRALLLDRLAWSAARTKRHQTGFAVVFLDLDRFKVINDGLGHPVGDQLLIGIARRLEACVRPGDTVARLGGDEFIILLDEIVQTAEAENVAMRIQAALAAPFRIAGQEIYTTASIGIALSSRGYTQPEDLVRDADAAMYRAKSLGRARHEFFDSAMHARVVSTLQTETALRRALDRDELLLEYQPIIRLADDSVTGFEALVRWRRHDRLIPPADFIPVAEDTGLIVPLGLWVLRTACAQMSKWGEAASGIVSLNVNLSPRQLSERSLLADIESALADSGLESHRLTLEITEGVLIEHPETALALLQKLREARIHICLDDFGTGYSSLNALHSYPIDTIKIDRSFIQRIGGERSEPHFAGAILTLARTLGMSVTAEGVETLEQLEMLREMRCDQAQGYLLARPLKAEEVPEFLVTRHQAARNLPARIPVPPERVM